MDELVQWLRVQLDEDERHAQGGTLRAVLPPDFEGLTREGTVHLTDPVQARVLREVDAKRQVLAKYAKAVERMEELAALCERLKADGKDTFMPDMERMTAIHRRDVLAEVLRLLALPYADRRGYREEWRP